MASGDFSGGYDIDFELMGGINEDIRLCDQSCVICSCYGYVIKTKLSSAGPSILKYPPRLLTGRSTRKTNHIFLHSLYCGKYSIRSVKAQWILATIRCNHSN